MDAEGDFTSLGRFEVVFCYGLLYHLENPLRALRNMAVVCDDLLLVETQVCDSPLPILRLADETLSANQALGGLAHRPSPAWMALALNRIGFQHIYMPTVAPAHPDFQFEWRGDAEFDRDKALLRATFVASRQPFAQPTLVPLVN
jgi:hypothetical protein